MFKIEYSPIATEQINEIYDNSQIYIGNNFTQKFQNWNREFYHYVGKETLIKLNLPERGVYDIGTIGKLDYYHFILKDDEEIFMILEFRFSKLPYRQKKQQYKVIGDAGYKYKIIQSIFNHKYTILTPQRKRLTKFAFDQIIGFHHSSNDYNMIYAVGFIGNRVYAIYQDGDIKVLPYSKEEYLTNKHRYDESIRLHKMILRESKINNIIKETLHKYIYKNRA